jgi:DNA-binding protein H-NS
MRTLDELLQQHEVLQKEIGSARKRERRVKVKEVRLLLEKYSLAADDVFPAQRKNRAAAATAGTGVKKIRPAKYRDPESGKTWSGVGRAPLWIRDRDASAFLISTAEKAADVLPPAGKS